MARSPSCGLGNLCIVAKCFIRKSIAWPSRLTQPLLSPSPGTNPYHRLGPGTVIKNQLQSIRAHHFLILCPQNSRGSDFNFSVNYSFTSCVKRKFSAEDNRNQLGYIPPHCRLRC